MASIEENIHLLLTEEELDESFCRAFIDSPDCGGIVVFIGTVRNHTKGKQVLHLEFESRGSMAIKEMRKIAEAAMQKWPVKKILIHHRVGDLQIGEVPVVIGVSAAHRDAAFAACQFAIDTLKETVPIWKKEYLEDGEVWVAAHP
jgi:molybdopterin synthase catalytic subunit